MGIVINVLFIWVLEMYWLLVGRYVCNNWLNCEKLCISFYWVKIFLKIYMVLSLFWNLNCFIFYLIFIENDDDGEILNWLNVFWKFYLS